MKSRQLGRCHLKESHPPQIGTEKLAAIENMSTAALKDRPAVGGAESFGRCLAATARNARPKMVSKDHELSVRRQCTLLTLTRSHLFYEPKGESAENLRFMGIIDKQFLETVARVAPSVRARWATVRASPVGALLAAQNSQMRSASRALPHAAHAFGPDPSGTQHEQETSPA